MSIKKMDMPAFEKWVSACIQHHKVYGVQAQGDRFSFAELERAEDLRLDYDVTILPPKKYFQPPREILLKFSRDDARYETTLDTEPFVLLGVHPYDMVAINQMDELFRQDNYDTHYMTRRKSATIVASDGIIWRVARARPWWCPMCRRRLSMSLPDVSEPRRPIKGLMSC